MSDTTEIEWTHVPGYIGGTWNPWHGCTKISPGCKFCYMYRDKRRYGQDPERVLRSKTKFSDPLKHKEPHAWFTCSWSDWFIKEADPWRDEAWEIIRRTPQHLYQILTKRIDRAQECLPKDWPLKNVWLGVSVESNAYRKRVAQLKAVGGAALFVSYEPALEEVDWNGHIHGIDWMIVGGESGPEARMFDVQWARSTIDQCLKDEVPCFVKQMGENVYAPDDYLTGVVKFTGKGDDPSEWPADLRVREWPRCVSSIKDSEGHR